MKACTVCKEIKPIIEYHKNITAPSGYASACKVCINKSKQSHRKTKDGLIESIYSEQKNSSKVRGHALPAYTLSELKDWINSNPKFIGLFQKWVSSGYNKWDRPSIDRLCNELGYSLDNIQLVSFKDNNQRSHKDASEGTNLGTTLTPVEQYTLSGEFVCSYKSMAKASEATGDSIAKISVNSNKIEQNSSTWLWCKVGNQKPIYKASSKYLYKLLDSSGEVSKVFFAPKEVKEFLGKKDLSPLHKAIRLGRTYLGNTWVREVKNGTVK